MTVVQSDRLTLSPLATSDADELLDLFNDPDVGRYLLDGETVSPEWVMAEIEGSEERFAEGSAGLWALRRREDADAPDRPAIVGIVGFRPFFDPPELQLIYALRPGVWGQGLATEAATAAIDFAFEVLGFDEVRAATDGPNEASSAILEGLGMTRWKVEPGTPWDTLFYLLRSSSWR